MDLRDMLDMAVKKKIPVLTRKGTTSFKPEPTR
jgi:hypothetical protein